MLCPTLAELPAPPPNKTGWPWTEESAYLDHNDQICPKISIVTPSYNQGEFLEETVRSVLLQGYPNLEYIIMDGGSTDDSVAIIRKYEPWLAYWVSEKDNGQADAINGGWRVASGEFISWLNSDDILMPDALGRAVVSLEADSRINLVFGDVYHIDCASHRLGYRAGRDFSLEYVLLNWHNITPQPGFLMRRTELDQTGFLDTELNFSMDFDYWLRVAIGGGGIKYIPHYLASARLHPAAKTSKSQILAAQDQITICRKILPLPERLISLKYHEPQIIASCYRMAAYWAYLAGDARATRQYAAVTLRYFGSRYNMGLVLWLLGCLGDVNMRRLRLLWQRHWR
jgi:glycosyltransferase involved in cell wall biosynthesis